MPSCGRIPTEKTEEACARAGLEKIEHDVYCICRSWSLIRQEVRT
jgi:hypothetical protein